MHLLSGWDLKMLGGSAPYCIYAWGRVPQQHRDLHTLKTEILLVEASEMIQII